MHNGLHYGILVYIDDMFNHIHTHINSYTQNHRMDCSLDLNTCKGPGVPEGYKALASGATEVKTLRGGD